MQVLCSLQLTQAAQADVPSAALVAQGGNNMLSEQRCTFLELALALAVGLNTDCIKLLFTTAKGAMQVCCYPTWTTLMTTYMP